MTLKQIAITYPRELLISSSKMIFTECPLKSLFVKIFIFLMTINSKRLYFRFTSISQLIRRQMNEWKKNKEWILVNEKKEIFSRILNFFVAKISLICGEGSRQISFCFDDIAALFTIKRLLITTAIQIFKTLLEFSSIY